jgi:alkylation response protein AidB-like acyl-CoA dehydrogenase
VKAEAYAIAAMVPVASPGVRIVNTTYAPRHGDPRTFPISSRHHMPEGFVIFDDVFVPKERVFLDGETHHAAVFAHSLGLWERLGGLSAFVEEADQLVGFAQLIAEANGLASEPHIREKISEMISARDPARRPEAASNCRITPGAAFGRALRAREVLRRRNYTDGATCTTSRAVGARRRRSRTRTPRSAADPQVRARSRRGRQVPRLIAS